MFYLIDFCTPHRKYAKVLKRPSAFQESQINH